MWPQKTSDQHGKVYMLYIYIYRNLGGGHKMHVGRLMASLSVSNDNMDSLCVPNDNIVSVCSTTT